MIEVEVRYNRPDTTLKFGVDQWPIVRADGVQWIRISCNGLSHEVEGRSIYWIYEQGGFIVIGGGCIRYDSRLITEVLINPETGRQHERLREYMPDLEHKQVKLGWWNGENLLDS